MLRRLTPYLVAAAVALTSTLGLVNRPATGAPSEYADYVIIAGAAGLRWDDVNPTDTPTMWQLAEHGSIGALSVGSARTPTCPADGWLTLGAGNYAQRTPGPVERDCPSTPVQIRTPDGIGADLPDQETDVAAMNGALPYGTQPGALAEAVRCTAAVGPGGAIAAAHPYGRVDRYTATLPKDPKALLSACVLSIVDLGTIVGATSLDRRTAARHADEVLAAVLAARPAHSLVLVAGLADTDLTSRLHVAIADGPGYANGWLTSSSTSRPGYLQLTDLAPTALVALDRPIPDKLFAGQPAGAIPGRPADLTTAVSRLSDADREAGAQRQVTGGFLTLLSLGELLLFVVAIPFLRRARRYAGPTGPRPMPARLVRILEVLLVAASLTLPAALIADAVPWWRVRAAGAVFGSVTIVVIAALTSIVVLGPWRRGALGPLGAVGGLVAGIVGLDVLTGARLQLNGVAGYSALEGGRYAGVGTVGLGLLFAGILLIAGWSAQKLRRRWRPVVVAVVGGIGVVLVGSPYLGANAGGAVALTAGVCVAAAICTGGFLTFARLAWATLTGLAVTTGFALLDLMRPAEDQGSLGRFLTQARTGTGGSAIHRTGAANTVAVLTSPLTLIVVGAGLLLLFVLLRPWGGLKRLFGIYPAIRAALIGTAVSGLLAGFLDGAGFVVAGAAAATAIPVACLGALRVLEHADDRTTPNRLAPTPTPADPPAADDVDAATDPVPDPNADERDADEADADEVDADEVDADEADADEADADEADADEAELADTTSDALPHVPSRNWRQPARGRRRPTGPGGSTQANPPTAVSPPAATTGDVLP